MCSECNKAQRNLANASAPAWTPAPHHAMDLYWSIALWRCALERFIVVGGTLLTNMSARPCVGLQALGPGVWWRSDACQSQWVAGEFSGPSSCVAALGRAVLDTPWLWKPHECTLDYGAVRQQRWQIQFHGNSVSRELSEAVGQRAREKKTRRIGLVERDSTRISWHAGPRPKKDVGDIARGAHEDAHRHVNLWRSARDRSHLGSSGSTEPRH